MSDNCHQESNESGAENFCYLFENELESREKKSIDAIVWPFADLTESASINAHSSLELSDPDVTFLCVCVLFLMLKVKLLLRLPA